VPDTLRDGAIVEFGGLLRHSERAVTKTRGHIFGGCPEERDLRVMDGQRAVHGDAGNQALLHQLDQNGRHAGLNDVTPERQHDGPIVSPGLHDGTGDARDLGSGKDPREARKEIAEAPAGPRRRRKVLEADFAGPLGKRLLAHLGEIEFGET
jgi:hypothetical protein